MENKRLFYLRKEHFFACLIGVSFFAVFFFSVPRAEGWWSGTHEYLSDDAENLFSPSSFFSNNEGTIVAESPSPDGWDRLGDSHYYDFDLNDFYGEEATNSSGNLPWMIAENTTEVLFNQENFITHLVDRVKARDWTTVADNLGHIGHFTQDIGVPLHCVENFWLDGYHSDYEGAAETHQTQENIFVPGWYLPKRIRYDNESEHGSHDGTHSGDSWGAWGDEGDNLFDYMMDTVVSGYENSYGPPDPPNLNYWGERDIVWNDNIHRITENRFRRVAQVTANVWYLAFIRGGQTIQGPNLVSPSGGESVTDNTPTFAWSDVEGTNYYDLELARDKELLKLEDPTVTHPSDLGSYPGAYRVERDLMDNSFTTDSLENGTWYWRVRSGDNENNVGLWSDIHKFTVSTSTVRSVDLSISPSEKSGSPGSSLNYSVSIVNTGSAVDNYDLTISDDAGWGLYLADNTIENLAPSVEKETTLTVTIPDKDNLVGVTDNITVTATSQENTSVSDSEICHAEAVEPPVGGVFHPEDGERLEEQGENTLTAFIIPLAALFTFLAFGIWWRRRG